MASQTPAPEYSDSPKNAVGRSATDELTAQIQNHAVLRFSDIPPTLDIPVQGMEGDDAQDVSIDLEELLDDPTELCDLLENEKVGHTFWMTIGLAYAKQKKVDVAIEMLNKGLTAIQAAPQEKLSLQVALCWLYMWKSREAPRTVPEGQLVSEAKIKDYYIRQGTQMLNDATRINAAYPPLFMARGVLYLLRASLQPPSKTSVANAIDPEKLDLLRHALKSFDDAIRISHGKNMMAVLGKARTFYSLNKFAEALDMYQRVLRDMPQMTDPDSRIGIGACLWQLNLKEDAKLAWDRALEVNPNSKIANILLGLYYLDASGHLPTNSKEFIELYKKAMTVYTQKSFKLDKSFPLTCATFAQYFLSVKSMGNVDNLAHKAIQYTDVNAIASDGWYLLARKEHYDGNVELAADYYRRADEARGGAERGYIPAKFGSAQISALKMDFGEAKFRLEKIANIKNIEAMSLLGTIYAEEVFAAQYATPAEDKSAEYKKAVHLLESVRLAWKNPERKLIPDASVLLNLARLYEIDHPEKSLQCLQQIEQLEYAAIPEEQKPQGTEAEEDVKQKIHENLPPQLLNNMGCFLYQAENYKSAVVMFQAGINASVKAENDDGVDADSLLATMTFNLGRTYEALGEPDQAKELYQKQLEKYDYIDARARLAYINLKESPKDQGPKAISELYKDYFNDCDIRALYGWYLGRVNARKRPSDIAQDPEYRHYKHTLQNFDKHDRYALIGMGNIQLQAAREMPRNSESEKAARAKAYSKAVEFFDKVLQLDPKNAYAAQGIAIAMIEDKKDFKGALTIFMQIRETIKDANVYINLAHLFAELKQWSKSIENYEIALSKSGGSDAGIIACLGRAWLSRGRSEKDLNSYKEALQYAKKALEIAPEQIHFKFNVAFVQIQLAQAIYGMPETARTLIEINEAIAGIEEAIISLEEIAKHPNTPYPKALIEGRANMARNTMRKQLERTAAAQKEYEEKNAEKVKEAWEIRQRELKAREDKRREQEEAEAERKRIIAEERRKIAEHDRMLAEQRAREREEKEEAEMTVDSETGERVKRKPKAKRAGGRRKKGDESGEESGEEHKEKKKRRSRKKTASGSEDEGESKPKSKRRRLEKKSGKAVKQETGKFKSAEVVVDSDEEADDGADNKGRGGDDDGYGSDAGKRSSPVSSPPRSDDEDEEERAPVQRTARRRLVESEDEDEDMEDVSPTQPALVSGDAEDDAALAKDEGGGGMTEGAEGGNVNEDESLANGTADVSAPAPDANGFKVGEVDAGSPARDREPDANEVDEPMGDADIMHDGQDDREEDEGEVYK